VNGLTKGPFKTVLARLGTDVLQADLKQETQRRVVALEREVAVTPEHPLEIALAR
jgi:hypothetical protein